MRALIVSALVIFPLLMSFALRAVTGDGLSAIVFALIILVSVIAWFSGRPIAASELKKW